MSHALPPTTCPICRILDAAQAQTLAVALTLFEAACQVRCGCSGTRHAALVSHPHARPGCVGYQAASSQLEDTAWQH